MAFHTGMIDAHAVIAAHRGGAMTHIMMSMILMCLDIVLMMRGMLNLDRTR